MDLKSHSMYHLYGPKPYIDKMKELVDSLTASGFVYSAYSVYRPYI